MRFNETVQEVTKLLLSPSQDQIKNMPMFYGADYKFAYENGDWFTRHFLDNVRLVDGYKYVSIDSKVHMLKKGWFPNIPGWHLDDFWRPTGEQPDLETLSEHNSLYHMIVWGDCSLTEFLKPIDFPFTPPKDLTTPVYGWYHKWIEDFNYRKYSIPESTIIRFTSLDFHQCTAAIKDGWRVFIRLMQSNHHEPKNEIRRNTQVYLSDPYHGW